MLADEREEEGKEADQHDEGEQAGEDTPQEVRTEEKGQNDPKKAIPEEVEAEDCAPTFAAASTPESMLSGRLEVFWFLLFFVVLFITFDFFLCRSGAGMDGILVQELCKAGLSPSKIFAPNTLARRERGRFCAKPPRGLILSGREARRYLRC